MAVAFADAGAGAETGTSGATLNAAFSATVNANDILICVKWIGNQTTTFNQDPPSGFTELSGGYVNVSTSGRFKVYGKLAAGTEDGTNLNCGTEATANNRAARIYRFTGRTGGTIAQIVRGVSTNNGTDASIEMPTVTTDMDGCMAVAVIQIADDNALASATGESGGDWTELVAEFLHATGTGSDGAMQIQGATMASAGTISGGSQTMAAADPWFVWAFNLAPDLAPIYPNAPKMGRYLNA